MNRALTIVAAALFIALPASTATAQGNFIAQRDVSFSSPRGADLSSSPITPSEFEAYIGILRLDEEMAAVARDMYEGFRAENAEIVAEIREKLAALARKAQETNDASDFLEKMPKIQADRTERTEKLRDTFLDDLKLLLTEEQAARWPLLEQNRRRTRVQSRLHISGANVDLIALVEETLDAVPAPITEKLETYARNLDRMLLDIIQLREQSAVAREMGMRLDPEEQEEFRERSDKQREISIDIRDLNDRTLRLLTAELDADDDASLTEAFRLSAFPQIYAPSYTDNAIAAAKNMGSLEPEQRDRLEALANAHHTATATMNERWERALREHEEEPGNTMFFSGPGGAAVEVTIEESFDGEEREISDLEKARDARAEHDEKTLARLHSILNQTQIADLPPKPIERNPLDPANLPEGANAIFISTTDDGGGEVTEIQVVSGGDANNTDDNDKKPNK